MNVTAEASARWAGASVRRIRWWQVRGGRVGNVQAEGQKDREGAAMQKRTGTRAGAPETKKGGGHTRLHLSPVKGEKKKGECTHP